MLYVVWMNTTLTHRPGVQFESRLRKTGRTIQNWQHDMKNAYQIAQQNAKKTAERGRESYKKSLRWSSQARRSGAS